MPLRLCKGKQPVPVSFCPLRPPPYIKALVRRVPTFPRPPPPPSQSKFGWTPAQMSTDSPSLSAALAHDLLWQLAPRAELQKRHPRPHCSPWPILPPKKLPAPQRRHAAKTGTTTTMASVLMCYECAVTASLESLGGHALAQRCCCLDSAWRNQDFSFLLLK